MGICRKRRRIRYIPGKMYILLPCPGYKVLFSYSIAGNGEPEAKRTLPSVYSIASWNEHSDKRTGLERGKIMGRGLRSFMARITSGVKAFLISDIRGGKSDDEDHSYRDGREAE